MILQWQVRPCRTRDGAMKKRARANDASVGHPRRRMDGWVVDPPRTVHRPPRAHAQLRAVSWLKHTWRSDSNISPFERPFRTPSAHLCPAAPQIFDRPRSLPTALPTPSAYPSYQPPRPPPVARWTTRHAIETRRRWSTFSGACSLPLDGPMPRPSVDPVKQSEALGAA